MMPTRKSAPQRQTRRRAEAARVISRGHCTLGGDGILDLTPHSPYVKGIGPARAAMLEAKGLVTVEDLLGYVPFRYEDRSNVKTIGQLAPGEMATVIAEGAHGQSSRASNAQTSDCSKRASPMPRAPSWWASGSTAATWPTCFAEGMKVALYGKVEFDSYAGELTMLHPEFEILSGDDDEGESSLHVGRIVPIYEAVSKITTKALRALDASHSGIAAARGRLPAARLPRPPEDAGPLDGHSPDALPAARFRPAPAERVSLAGAVPPDLRGVLLAGMRRGAEARQGADAARHRVRDQRPRARTGQGDAAVQAHRRAEARDQGDRRRHEGAAAHESPAAGRRGQRQDHRGRRSGGHRDRERIPGGGAGAHRNPGDAARPVLQADPLQARLRHACC